MNKSDHHGRMGATAALLLRLRRRRRATVANLAAHCFSGCCPLGNIQNILARKLTFRSDYGLIATGVIAAISSVAFAIFMISEGSNPEMVKKGEIARFFARGLLAKSDKSPGSINKPDTRPIRYRNIDYDVTGSISMHGPGVTGQKISPDSVIDGISTPVNAVRTTPMSCASSTEKRCSSRAIAISTSYGEARCYLVPGRFCPLKGVVNCGYW
jgi:hypothetical protein